MDMQHDDQYVNLVYALLQKAVRARKFKSYREQLLYEKGYLIGFIAALACADSFVYRAIKKKVDRP